MAETTRSELRRLDAEQNRTYKRSFVATIFVVVSLILFSFTLMNPSFMKGITRTSNGQAVIDAQINAKFDRLAVLVNGKKNSSSNLLTSNQTQVLSDELIDYTLGIHWFKTDNASLANEIYSTLNKEIDSNSDTEAQSVMKALKKQGDSSVYTIISAFDLADVTQQTNLVTMFLIINTVLVIVLILSLISTLMEMREKLRLKAIIHEVTGAGMWTGALMITIYVILAMIPLIFNVESITLLDFGYWLELASSVFLEYVMFGAIIFVINTIPWQITSTK